MSLRIYGATSGYIELDAPAVANSASVTLPTTNGVLATESFANTAGGLVYITGQTFAAVSAVNVNGCFSSTYENYLVTVRVLGSTDENLNLRLRVGGTDASGTNYRQQDLNITSAGVSSGLSLVAQYRAAAFGTANPTSGQIQFHRPNIAERTSMISHMVTGNNTTALYLPVCNHELATAYDGFSLLPAAGATVTGTIRIYGYRNS